jgi:hypothetical protein
MLDASLKITTGAVLAAAFLAATAFAQKPKAEEDPRLQEARKLLQSTKEDQVRQGAKICAQLDSPASAELLLEVLNRTVQTAGGQLPPPHYRDIAWEGLIELKSPYAHRRIEMELVRNKESAWVRQWCARRDRNRRSSMRAAARAKTYVK